ncbi:MAG: DUF1631 family protein [Gammaproteobacteria bacterium]|nr:DUF1631 family protein [Gammaproteobacteria bacterium]
MNLGQADEDIINVVAMFFDVILDDRNLPLEIQALVSRLQLPVLKVALKHRSFFTDRKHPARQLINEIARTSIGWESSDRDEQDAVHSPDRAGRTGAGRLCRTRGGVREMPERPDELHFQRGFACQQAGAPHPRAGRGARAYRARAGGGEDAAERAPVRHRAPAGHR